MTVALRTALHLAACADYADTAPEKPLRLIFCAGHFPTAVQAAACLSDYHSADGEKPGQKDDVWDDLDAYLDLEENENEKDLSGSLVIADAAMLDPSYNGRTLIFHTEEVTLANGTVATHYTSLCMEPGLFIDRGLTQGVAELRQMSSELPRPLPRDVIRMNTALEALNGVTLGSEATPDSVRGLMQKLDEMKKAAESYYKKHETEWDNAVLAGEDRKIAEARLGFAGELITFAEKKTYLLSGIQEYMKALEDLGLYRQQPEEKAELNEERGSVADGEEESGEEEKENDRLDRSNS